jgi:hypothetical protein
MQHLGNQFRKSDDVRKTAANEFEKKTFVSSTVASSQNKTNPIANISLLNTLRTDGVI